MANIKRTFAVLAGSIGLLAASLTFASSAHAGSSHCYFAGPASASDLCIYRDPTGYQAYLFADEDLRGHTVDFNLVCDNGRWAGDLGAFSVGAYRKYTYVFAVGDQGSCHVRLTDITVNKSWNSPSLKW
ncbi:hypothetical protein [Wenjunlia tyrosinilytica]|uniref:Uncharacterized protein n=1 Tax=Wenjunlia tyrosinilytica TaxID=1544741 RepID=A0A917ZTM7_9ACTN|nr:hypothetical protein [Wenjunlia tyrosinilytica]GGO93352.1 hypothetical protein GCM10012280_45690 [Wenjunlia tyrosinilytica]